MGEGPKTELCKHSMKIFSRNGLSAKRNTSFDTIRGME